jgi:uncharacterized cupin superfamily protein
MITAERIRRTTIGAERWQAHITSDGRTIGEAEWLRRRTEPGASHTAMLWRCDPLTFEYNFPGDESFVGAVRIDLTNDGTSVELRSGTSLSFLKGTRSVWTVLEPIEKFTVVSGS